MLFFLTGDIQIGKTRWLESVIEELERSDVTAYGVIAPGRWVRSDDGFKKLGIDNLLLPQRTRIAFAEPGEKGWLFDQDAIEQVNSHFRDIAKLRANADGSDTKGSPTSRTSQTGKPAPGLLVVDEFGWMELQCERGLTAAVELIDAGADAVFPHAIVVVRESLLQTARERFSQAQWNGIGVLSPTDESKKRIMACWD